jgi:menaquinone-9 beta-reductase
MSAASSFDVIIAGGGPAGSSAAIHLAQGGARVLLAEQKKFPRAKLCGEFISPECTRHFERLGVGDEMLAANPARLTQTIFYSRQGKSVSVPSAWFGGVALGLSRAEMDECLLRRAVAAGVEVLEEANVVALLKTKAQIEGVVIKLSDRQTEVHAALTIDATGRARTLARKVSDFSGQWKSHRPPMVAFKAHLTNAQVAPGACEIYFYRGGYGGLSSIENGLSNLCFIASARSVRECGADANRAMREVVCQNRRAAKTLETAQAGTRWLAVSLEGFGRYPVTPVRGLISIGDAASFIDPFTGSGMLMALESGELAATVISNYLSVIRSGSGLDEFADSYRKAYRVRFSRRLGVCSVIRRAAFVPGLARLAIGAFGTSDYLRRRLSRATRSGGWETYSLSERLNDDG